MMSPGSDPLVTNGMFRPHHFVTLDHRPRHLSPHPPPGRHEEKQQQQEQERPKERPRTSRNKSYDETSSHQGEVKVKKKRNLRSLFFSRRARSTPCSDTEDDPHRASSNSSDVAEIPEDEPGEEEEFSIDLSNLCPPSQTPPMPTTQSHPASKAHSRAASPRPLTPRRTPSVPTMKRDLSPPAPPARPRTPSPPSPRRTVSPAPCQLIWLESDQMWLRAEPSPTLPPPPRLSSPQPAPHSSRSRPASPHQHEQPRVSLDTDQDDDTVSNHGLSASPPTPPLPPSALASLGRPPIVIVGDDEDANDDTNESDTIVSALVPPPCYHQSQWEEAFRRGTGGESRWEAVGARQQQAGREDPVSPL